MTIYQKNLPEICIALDTDKLSLAMSFDKAHFQTVLSYEELQQLAQMFREAVIHIGYDNFNKGKKND